MMKSIFLENKYSLFYKESFVSSISATINVVSGDLPTPHLSLNRVYCNNFVRRMNVSK